eukprot:1144829-Pelagomonas_calceolata.AAC.1
MILACWSAAFCRLGKGLVSGQYRVPQGGCLHHEQGVTEILDGLDSLAAPTNQNLDTAPLQRACEQGRGLFSSSDSCRQMTALASFEEFLALRAGALCNVLGSCDPYSNCKIEQPGGEAQDIAMDYWWICSNSFMPSLNEVTTDGTVNGRLVGTKTAAPEEGACFEDADCSNEAACTWSEDVTSVLECQRTGLDEAKAQGKCKSPCETARVKDLIQSSASAFKTCNSNDDCEVGKGLAAIGSSICRQAPQSCKIYSCSLETGQSTAQGFNCARFRAPCQISRGVNHTC